MLTVRDSVSEEQHRIVRGRTVAKLLEIGAALRDAEDLAAMEVVQRAINELGNLEARDSKKNRRRATGSRMRDAAAAVGSSIEVATATTTRAVRAAASRAADLAAIAAEKGSTMLRSGASGVAGGLAVAHEALADFGRNLDWSTITPTEYVEKFVTAGTSSVDRTMEQARAVWEMIPEQLRALGPEEMAARLWGADSAADRFDWSHIVPRSQGGGQRGR